MWRNICVIWVTKIQVEQPYWPFNIESPLFFKIEQGWSVKAPSNVRNVFSNGFRTFSISYRTYKVICTCLGSQKYVLNDRIQCQTILVEIWHHSRLLDVLNMILMGFHDVFITLQLLWSYIHLICFTKIHLEHPCTPIDVESPPFLSKINTTQV